MSDPAEDLSRAPKFLGSDQCDDSKQQVKDKLASSIQRYPEFPHLVIVEERNVV